MTVSRVHSISLGTITNTCNGYDNKEKSAAGEVSDIAGNPNDSWISFKFD